MKFMLTTEVNHRSTNQLSKAISRRRDRRAQSSHINTLISCEKYAAGAFEEPIDVQSTAKHSKYAIIINLIALQYDRNARRQLKTLLKEARDPP